MNDQVEGAAVAKSDGREVADISRRETTNAKIFGEHHDRRVDETEAKVAVSPVNCHGPCELIDSRRRVSERPAREIVHESVHGRPLVAKEVVNFRQHQPRNVSRACSVDRLSETVVIACPLHEVVEQRAGIAD